jgi:WD40 repeat protein
MTTNQELQFQREAELNECYVKALQELADLRQENEKLRTDNFSLKHSSPEQDLAHTMQVKLEELDKQLKHTTEAIEVERKSIKQLQEMNNKLSTEKDILQMELEVRRKSLASSKKGSLQDLDTSNELDFYHQVHIPKSLPDINLHAKKKELSTAPSLDEVSYERAHSTPKKEEYAKMSLDNLNIKQKMEQEKEQLRLRNHSLLEEAESLRKQKLEFEEYIQRFTEEKAKFFAIESRKTKSMSDLQTKSLSNKSSPFKQKQDTIEEAESNIMDQKPKNFNIDPIKCIAVHSSEIYSLSPTVEGTTFVTSGGDFQVKITKVITNDVELFSMGGGKQLITCVNLDLMTDDMMALGSNEGFLRIWSLKHRTHKFTLSGHQDRISSLEWILHDDQLLSASYDRTIKLWDVNQGSLVRNIHCGTKCIDAKVIPDGKLVVSGHYDKSVKIHSLHTGERIADIKQIHDESITSIAISPDKHYLVTSSKDNTCRIIDLRMNLPLEFVLQHDGDVYYQYPYGDSKVCFGHEGKSVIAGGRDGSIFIWNATDGKISNIKKRAHDSYITGCYYHPVMQYYYTTDSIGKVMIWK